MPTHSLDLESASSQYASIADASQTGLENPTTGLTLEAWVKLESTGAARPVITKNYTAGSWAGPYVSYMMRVNSTGVIEFGTSNGTTYDGLATTDTITVGQWTHIACVYNGTNKYIYINGRQSASGAYSATLGYNTGSFEVGHNEGAEFFDGLVKDARVFSDARTVAEIASDARTESVSDANLVGEWNLNNTYTDASGNSNTLTASGSPVFSVDIPWRAPTGVQSSKYVLDLEAGSSQYASITDAAQTGLDLTGDFSIEAWVMFESLPTAGGFYVIVGKTGGSEATESYFYGLLESSGTLYFHGNARGGTGSNFTQVLHAWTPKVGVWYHTAFTFTASTSTLRTYVDGVLLGSTTGSNTSVQNTSADVQVGRYAAGSNYFDGLIREVRIFNDVRTQVEILSDALAATVSDANLKAEWKFDNAYTDSSGNSNTLTASGSPIFKQWANSIAGGLTSWWTLDESSNGSGAVTRNDSHGSNHLTDNNTTPSATGKKSNGADFERGNTEYLSITDASQAGLDGIAKFSVSQWVKVETAPTTGQSFGLFSKDTASPFSGGRSYNAYYRNNGGTLNVLIYVFQNFGSTIYTTANWNVDLGTAAFKHVVLIFDGAQSAVANKLRLYVDGIEIAQTGGSNIGGGATTVENSSGDFTLGVGLEDTAGTPFDGIYDETGFWSRVLEYGEVLDLYNASNAISYTGATNATITPSAQAATFSIPAYSVLRGSRVFPSAQAATFSVPAYTVSLPKTVSVGVQSATFSIPAYSAGGFKIVAVNAVAATFSIPAYSILRDYLLAIAGAVSATFSTPSRTIVQGIGVTVTPAAQVGTFSTPARTIIVVANKIVAVGVQVLTFSLPTLAKVGAIWRKVARSTNSDWTRVGRNSS